MEISEVNKKYQVKIKSRASQMKFKFSRLVKLIILLIILSQNLINCSTCSSSTSSLNAISIQQDLFQTSSNTTIFTIATGRMSGSIYYLYYLTSGSSDYCAVRRVSSDDTQVWMSVFNFIPVLKGLFINQSEDKAFIAAHTNQIQVLILKAVDGSVNSGQTFTNINGNYNDIKIFPISDNSGYYFITQKSPARTNLCQYLYTSPSNLKCHQITNLAQLTTGQLMLSDTQFICSWRSSFSSNQYLIYKVTFDASQADWSSQLTCTGGACTASYSECQKDSAGLSIYCLLVISNTEGYIQYVRFNLTDGSVIGNRYRSNSSSPTAQIYQTSLNGDDILLATAQLNLKFYLLVIDISSTLFTVKSYGWSLYGCVVDPSSNKFIVGGTTADTNGYITKFTISSLPNHPDFTTSSSLTMQLLSPSVDPITSISPGLIEAEASIAASSVIFINKTFNYSNTSSIINYQTDIESIYVIKNRNSKVKSDLACSSTNTISYSIAQYGSSAIPAWISIDSSTGELTISAPEVSADSEYDFYINSQVSGFTNTVQKLIKLIVKNCAISHCDIYSDGSTCACSTCGTGFTICTKNCDNQTTSSLNYCINSNSVSELASSAATVSQCVIGGTIAVTTLSSLTNASSIAGIWSLINQAQLFFLILLSRVYIPNDVKAVITGPNFAFNPYGSIPFEKVELYSSIINNFNFGLSNKILEPLKINSDSTIYNIMPFVDFTIIVVLCHLALWITLKLFSKCNTGEDANRFTKFIKWFIERMVRILTFGYYIRSVLEINQLFLISTINEIYEWNTSAKLRIVSLIFAILIIGLCILVILFAAYLALSSYRIIEGQHNKLGEFLSGVKSQNKFKFYVAILLTRRILFVLILICAVSVSCRYVVISLVILQAIYLSYIVLLRPFTNLKCNSIEIINETTSNTVYVWLISSNSMTTFLIVFIGEIIKCYIKVKSKCNRSESQRNRQSPISVVPKQMKRTQIKNEVENNISRNLGNAAKLNSKGLIEENKLDFEEN